MNKFVLALSLALVAVGCSKEESAPVSPAPASLDGSWKASGAVLDTGEVVPVEVVLLQIENDKLRVVTAGSDRFGSDMKVTRENSTLKIISEAAPEGAEANVLEIVELTETALVLSGKNGERVTLTSFVRIANDDEMVTKARAELTVPVEGESDESGAAATEPTATEPTATEPTATEPTTTEPTATEPTATEPTTTEPTATEPTATEPTTTEPTATEPAPTEPAPTVPAPTVPAPTEPAPTEPPSAN